MVDVDQLSARYADLLSGGYDCVDRVVLNAYYPLGHTHTPEQCLKPVDEVLGGVPSREIQIQESS